MIKVSGSASFISIVKRVQKALDKRQGQSAGPKTNSNYLQNRSGGSSNSRAGNETNRPDLRTDRGSGRQQQQQQQQQQQGITEDAQDDVVLIATGKAIQKVVEVGGFFSRESQLRVLARTRTISAVDEVLDEDGEEAEEGGTRVRGVSCLEVGVRWVN